MDWAAALKLRIERQQGFQMGREGEEIHDHYTDFYCEALEWVMEQIKQLECAEEKEQPLLPEMPDALCEACDD